MKILIVSNDMGLGGITTSVRNFCHEMIKQGHSIDHLILSRESEKISGVNNVYIKGIRKYININQSDIHHVSGYRKLFFLSIGFIKKIINKNNKWIPFILYKYKFPKSYDVAIAYRQCAQCYYFVSRCVNASKKIALIHGNLNNMDTTSSWDYLLPEFDKIATVSNACGNDFKQAFPQISHKVKTLYNMFNVAQIKAYSTEVCKIKVNKDIINIITVARHDNWQKNVDRIPYACAELIKRGFTHFHWYIVGNGPHLEYNKQLSNNLGTTNYLTICGALSNPFSLMKQCDISVLTSSTEAYSMTVIESKILNLPQVVMRYPGIEEALIDGVEGLIAEQSIESLCNCLHLLLTDTTLRKMIRKNLKEKPYSNELPYSQFLDMAN